MDFEIKGLEVDRAQTRATLGLATPNSDFTSTTQTWEAMERAGRSGERAGERWAARGLANQAVRSGRWALCSRALLWLATRSFACPATRDRGWETRRALLATRRTPRRPTVQPNDAGERIFDQAGHSSKAQSYACKSQRHFSRPPSVPPSLPPDSSLSAPVRLDCAPASPRRNTSTSSF